MDEVITAANVTTSSSSPSSSAALFPSNLPLLSAFLAFSIAQFLKNELFVSPEETITKLETERKVFTIIFVRGGRGSVAATELPIRHPSARLADSASR
ncbi:hypothetical protein ACSBR2_027738 [Camellia fascicularis]